MCLTFLDVGGAPGSSLPLGPLSGLVWGVFARGGAGGGGDACKMWPLELGDPAFRRKPDSQPDSGLVSHTASQSARQPASQPDSRASNQPASQPDSLSSKAS